MAGLARTSPGGSARQREAAHARRNLALLNEAGARIGNSLDLETTARELLDVAVPGFCDLASVDLYQALLSGDGGRPLGHQPTAARELRRVAFASAVSDAPVAAGDDAARPPTVGAPSTATLSTRPAPTPCAPQPRPQDVPGPGGGLVQSTLAVPMVAHDTVVGLVQFSRAKGSEPFGERDRMLAVELAARAAVCIDNARLYRREHERALILQRSLLPPATRRRPASTSPAATCRATSATRGRRRLVRRHRTARPPHRPGGRRRHGPRPARRGRRWANCAPPSAPWRCSTWSRPRCSRALDEIARGLGAPGGGQRPTSVASERPATPTWPRSTSPPASTPSTTP